MFSALAIFLADILRVLTTLQLGSKPEHTMKESRAMKKSQTIGPPVLLIFCFNTTIQIVFSAISRVTNEMVNLDTLSNQRRKDGHHVDVVAKSSGETELKNTELITVNTTKL